MFKSLKRRLTNIILCIKYPIIIPRTTLNDKMCTNFFSHTWLDNFPIGWRKLGLNFFKELQEALNKYPKDERKSFRIYNIKEKYGRLAIHFNWYTNEVDQVVTKYEKISSKTCVACGDKARWLTKGYVVPMCNKCKREYKHKYKFIPLYKNHKKRRRHGQ